MINQAHRHPGHATRTSTRPVETFRPHLNLYKNVAAVKTVGNMPKLRVGMPPIIAAGKTAIFIIVACSIDRKVIPKAGRCVIPSI